MKQPLSLNAGVFMFFAKKGVIHSFYPANSNISRQAFGSGTQIERAVCPCWVRRVLIKAMQGLWVCYTNIGHETCFVIPHLKILILPSPLFKSIISQWFSGWRGKRLIYCISNKKRNVYLFGSRVYRLHPLYLLSREGHMSVFLQSCTDKNLQGHIWKDSVEVMSTFQQKLKVWKLWSGLIFCTIRNWSALKWQKSNRKVCSSKQLHSKGLSQVLLITLSNVRSDLRKLHLSYTCLYKRSSVCCLQHFPIKSCAQLHSWHLLGLLGLCIIQKTTGTLWNRRCVLAVNRHFYAAYVWNME